MSYYEGIFERADQNAERIIDETCSNVETNNNEVDVICENRKDNNHGAVRYNLKKNVWADFANSQIKGKGVISFIAYLRGIPMHDAIAIVAKTLGIEPTKNPRKTKQKVKSPVVNSNSDDEVWKPIIPIPNDAPPSPKEHYKFSKHDVEYCYLNENGNLLYKIYRYESIEGKRKKKFLPLTYCTNSSGNKMWRYGFGNLKRSIFGLELLSQNCNKKILIVEGEKTCMAARALFKYKYLVVTWHGGCQSVNKTDWTPLSKKQVVIWPDYDEAGYSAAETLSKILLELKCDVKIVDLPYSENFRGINGTAKS